MNDFIERISKLSPKRLVLLAAEQQARLLAAEQAAGQAAGQAAFDSDQNAIAVIGMGLRVPGGAQSPAEFWQFLLAGGDGIRPVPPARWDIDALYDPDPETPGKMASRWGGFVDGVDEFDPQFFGITPREAATMDPQQRMLLEVSWQAFEHAGYAPDRLAGSRTGVFVGACNGDYYQMLLATGDENMEMYTSTGNAHSVISGRVSYLFGLQGPSLTVDTACSSSLVALHLACRSLRQGECRMALAGGVNAILSPDTTIALSKAKMMAPDGRCKAFDAAADGFVRSEGCGVVLLKRLADAAADGDRILAVVRGSAINQDGRSNGLTAPNGPSQVAVIRQALADAALEPAQIGYVETHGTGTSLGDPIEVQALAQAVGAARPADHPLLIGSVKTNIGHLESAAGVAGFIKLVLALQHKQIPPHLHLKQLNPHIAWDELPVRVAAGGAAWEPIDGRWLGGVSSFGFSGTNVHMILEAASPEMELLPLASVPPAERPIHLIQLSARSASALQKQAENMAAFLATTDAGLADIAYTANTGRATFAHRLALTASSRLQAQSRLAAFAQDSANFEGFSGYVPSQRTPQTAFLFSGHGGQYAGMGEQLYATQPVFRLAFDQCADLFRQWLPTPLHEMLTPTADGAPAAWMESMRFAQPALFALQYALAQLWRSWGLEPNALMGHSLGEYAAACVAGVFSLEGGVKLVATRSRLMDTISADGVMAAVFAGEEQVSAAIAPYAGEVAIAALNGPQTTVISGVAAAVDSVVADLARAKVRSRRLAVAQGAHSPLIDSVLDEFEAVAATVAYAEPQITLVSSLFGRPLQPGEVTNATYWRRHLRQPVRFADAMQALYAGGNDVFVEIGPNPMLLAMGQRCLPEAEAVWAASLRQGREDWQQLLDSAGALFTYGIDLDWTAIDRSYARRRLALPTYPFERQRYWFASTPSRGVSPRHAVSPAHPLLGERLRSPALQDIVFETTIGRHQPAFLDHHSIFGVVILPSPAYLEMALSAAAELFPAASHAVENFTIHAPLLLPADSLCTVQLLIKPPSGVNRTGFQILSWEEANAGWKLHATGDLVWEAALPAVDDEPFAPAALQLRCPHQIDGAAYYAQVRALGLTFGDSFQGIRQVWIGEREALGHIVLPENLSAEAAHYRFHPALLDACFHLLGAPLAKDGMDAAYLLIGIDRLQVYAAPGAELWNHTRLVEMAGRDAETFSGDIRLYNSNGQLVAEAQGLQLKRADQATLLRAIGQRPADWLYRVDWKLQVLRTGVLRTEAGAAQRRSDGPWLIFAESDGPGADLGRQLAVQLRSRGDRCILVEPGAAFAWQNDQAQLDPLAPDQFQTLLAQPALAALHKVVYLWGYAEAGAAERTCGALLHLVQALAASSTAPARGLWVATQHAQPVGETPVTAAGAKQAALWGLGRVAALEQPQLWGGLVDLDEGDTHTGSGTADSGIVAQHLLAEIDGGGDEDQIAWRAGSRYVARLAANSATKPATKPAGVPTQHPLSLRRDAAYLITGGLGGLGLEVAHWLAEQGAGHLVLVGRHGLPPRSEWPQLAVDSDEARRAQAVTTIEHLGAVVTVVAADVSSETAMAALFARFGVELPPLCGIVHTAADLSSAPITELDFAALQEMLRPKVQGTWLLHELTTKLDLDFFVLFSSTTALLGANGLAHYAAANAFLDSFAHYRHSLGLPATSINWGAWSVMRAASQAEQRRVAESGLEQMAADQALALLGECLAEPQPAQVMIAAVHWAALKPIYEARRARPFLTLVGSSSQGRTPPRQEPVADLPAQYQAARPEDRRDLLIERLRQAVAKVVGMADPSAIDPHQGLFEMGLDSLMSVELKTQLERQVGRSLPSTLTFNYPTIHDLAGYLETQVLAIVPAEEPTPAAAPTVAAPSNGDIDDLSEDELAKRLLQRLGQLR